MTDITNTDLAQRISALVDRWNTRENQMILLLTQEDGTVSVTDGVGVDHVLPSFPALQKQVTSMADAATGIVAQVQDSTAFAASMASAASNAAGEAEDHASAAANSAEASAASATDAAASAASSATSASAAGNSATQAATSAAAGSASASQAASSASQAATYKEAAQSAASAASASQTAAQNAKTLAEQYANAPVDTQVESGEYSAKHWASKAQAAVTGTLVYMGTWDASTGVYPANPNKGHFYKVTSAGITGDYSFSVGDQIVYNGDDWDVIDNSDQVTTVAGKSGAVVLVKADVGLGNVDNTSDANKPISNAVQAALSNKQDKLGFTPLNKAGDEVLGNLTMPSGIFKTPNVAGWGTQWFFGGAAVGGLWNNGSSVNLMNILGGWDKSHVNLKDGSVEIGPLLAVSGSITSTANVSAATLSLLNGYFYNDGDNLILRIGNASAGYAFFRLEAGGNMAALNGSIYADSFRSATGSAGLKFLPGDDAGLWDLNVQHTIGVVSQSDNNQGFISFGTSGSCRVGFNGSTFGVNGNEVLHTGNSAKVIVSSSQPAYIDGAVWIQP